VRIARKHLAWYTAGLPGGDVLRAVVNDTTSAAAQSAAVDEFFDALAARGERLVYRDTTADVGAGSTAHGTSRGSKPERAARPWAGEALAA